MSQLDPELLARGIDTLAGASKSSIKLFLVLLSYDVGLADAIDIVHEYGQGKDEESWGLGPSITQRNEPDRPRRGRPPHNPPSGEDTST